MKASTCFLCFVKRIDDELICVHKYYSMEIAKQSRSAEEGKGIEEGHAALRAEFIYCRKGPLLLLLLLLFVCF